MKQVAKHFKENSPDKEAINIKDLPDEIDIKLLSKLTQELSLTNMQEFLGIKQPTISMRLKRLENHGFIVIKGRKREITDLGRTVAGINNLEFNDKIEDK